MGVNSLPKTVTRVTRQLASWLQFKPRPFCAWVQHANHSATEPPCITNTTCEWERDVYAAEVAVKTGDSQSKQGEEWLRTPDNLKTYCLQLHPQHGRVGNTDKNHSCTNQWCWLHSRCRWTGSEFSLLHKVTTSYTACIQTWGPDLQNILRFIVRSTYDSDLKRAKIYVTNIAS